jgi:DNA repair protein RadC
MNSPEKVARFARDFLRIHEQTEEYLYMICVNYKLEMTSVMELSHGNVNSSIFSVREILQEALLANAVSICMIHNHPSGDPTPSRQDVESTERLVKAGDLIGIQVLDHLIIGRPTFSSLKEKGYI